MARKRINTAAANEPTPLELREREIKTLRDTAAWDVDAHIMRRVNAATAADAEASAKMIADLQSGDATYAAGWRAEHAVVASEIAARWKKVVLFASKPDDNGQPRTLAEGLDWQISEAERELLSRSHVSSCTCPWVRAVGDAKGKACQRFYEDARTARRDYTTRNAARERLATMERERVDALGVR